MKKPTTIIMRIVAFLIWVFSGTLIFLGSYSLSTGFSYHLSSRLGITINIVGIIVGSFVFLGNTFFIFFVYLPQQRKEQLEAIRDRISRAIDEAPNRQELSYKERLEAIRDGISRTIDERPNRRRRPDKDQQT